MMPAIQCQRSAHLATRFVPRLWSGCALCLAAIILPATALAQDAVTLSNDTLAALARYERQLEDLETRYDSYHASLLEPLQAMEALLDEQGQYQQVAELQDRQLQLLRTSLGFEHPDLVPVLEGMIATQMRLRNWSQVTDHLEHIRYLQSVNHGNDSAQVLDAWQRQAQWQLNQVFLDREVDRASLVLDARDIFDDTLDLAEEKYGKDDPALVPWLYRRALSLYYQVALLNTDSGLAGRTIEEVSRRDGMTRLNSARQGRVFSPLGFGSANRIPVVDGDEPVGVAYLRQALSFINDIEDIAQAHDDAELQALAQIYHGDYHLLMDRSSGQRDYQDAHEQLVAIGIDSERVDRFFARPMPIPLPEFFTSFDAMERYQQSLYADLPGAEENIAYVGVFTAWDEDVAEVALPQPPARFPPMQINSNEVELEFRISSRGQVSSVDVIEVWPHERETDRKVERKAWRAARHMQFRPAFVDGRNQTTQDARIRYRYFVREEP